jgi:hypothetical protein
MGIKSINWTDPDAVVDKWELLRRALQNHANQGATYASLVGKARALVTDHAAPESWVGKLVAYHCSEWPGPDWEVGHDPQPR